MLGSTNIEWKKDSFYNESEKLPRRIRLIPLRYEFIVLIEKPVDFSIQFLYVNATILNLGH